MKDKKRVQKAYFENRLLEDCIDKWSLKVTNEWRSLEHENK